MTTSADRIKEAARRRRQVAKPTVCKTVIHRFESGRRLHLALALASSLALPACDPPAPPPEPGPPDLPRWSEAPHVAWAGPSTPISHPLAVFVDLPGGPMDTIASDPDVATFLNDRFHPWFLVPEAAPDLASPPAALFLDAYGCLLRGPDHPESPRAWIEEANAVLLALAQGTANGRALPEQRFGFDLPEDHPLRGRCAGAGPAPG